MSGTKLFLAECPGCERAVRQNLREPLYPPKSGTLPEWQAARIQQLARLERSLEGLQIVKRERDVSLIALAQTRLECLRALDLDSIWQARCEGEGAAKGQADEVDMCIAVPPYAAGAAPASEAATSATAGENLPGPEGALAVSENLCRKVAEGTDLRADLAWIGQALAAHNSLRELHGCPPLQWSDDCAAAARLCADACAQQGTMQHSHCQEHGHGQNIFVGTAGSFSAAAAVRSWYDEVQNPGYVTGIEGSQAGTGHFTALVWLASTHVGLNVDSLGQGYIVANYAPAGNMDGSYLRNVPPLGSPMSQRLCARTEPATLVTSELTDEVESILNATPQDGIVAKVREHLRECGEAEISFKPAPGGFIRVRLLQPSGGATCMSASW